MPRPSHRLASRAHSVGRPRPHSHAFTRCASRPPMRGLPIPAARLRTPRRPRPLRGRPRTHSQAFARRASRTLVRGLPIPATRIRTPRRPRPLRGRPRTHSHAFDRRASRPPMGALPIPATRICTPRRPRPLRGRHRTHSHAFASRASRPPVRGLPHCRHARSHASPAAPTQGPPTHAVRIPHDYTPPPCITVSPSRHPAALSTPGPL